MKRHFSPTYTALLDLLFKTRGDKSALNTISQKGGQFHRDQTDIQTLIYRQNFYISASELFTQCSMTEWHLVGRISSELKEYNALWYCDPKLKKNSSTRKAIQGLIDKGVLFTTETTNIYLVNPIFIRRGDVFSVLATTAELVSESSKVAVEHIVNKKPVKFFDYGGAKAVLSLPPSSSDEPVLSLC